MLVAAVGAEPSAPDLRAPPLDRGSVFLVSFGSDSEKLGLSKTSPRCPRAADISADSAGSRRRATSGLMHRSRLHPGGAAFIRATPLSEALRSAVSRLIVRPEQSMQIL
jgi:hypothetical protein